MKLGIIGAGNLGKAIIDQMMENEIETMAGDINEGAYKGIKIIADNKKVAQNSDVIILAVKPQSMSDVLTEIMDCVSDKLIISFAAGLKIKFFESKLNANIVRAMTNIAIRNRQGVTVYKLGNSCSIEDKGITEEILNYLGKCIEVDDEDLLDIVTGISGSGIAYFIRIIDVFIEFAKSQGMDEKIAKRVIIETVRGALSLMEDNGYTTHEIISSIASKGGTTEQGLKELEERDLDETLRAVLSKTIEKCKEISN